VTRRDWDVIVVGLGAFGSAAAYWASTRPGVRVLGIEQFELGHANGASADHSRIIRLSYHRPDYVRLAKRAYETWAAVEAEADDRIVTVTGGLDLWPADPAIPQADYTGSLAAETVPFELLEAREIMRRWPAWRLTDDVTGVWQAQGGIADPYRGNAAHQRLATSRGATLIERTPVEAIREVGGAYEVDAGRTTYGAGRVVITADAWTNELLANFDRRLPLTVSRSRSPTSRHPTRRSSPPTVSRSGSGWTTRRSTGSRSTASPARRSPKTAVVSRRPPTPARSNRTRPSGPASERSSRTICPGRSVQRSTPRRASTR
jgi:glycine/D-amino acid oxidase-like deaminating enzyme